MANDLQFCQVRISFWFSSVCVLFQRDVYLLFPLPSQNQPHLYLFHLVSSTNDAALIWLILDSKSRTWVWVARIILESYFGNNWGHWDVKMKCICWIRIARPCVRVMIFWDMCRTPVGTWCAKCAWIWSCRMWMFDHQRCLWTPCSLYPSREMQWAR